MEILQLLATCLECGEQWRHVLPGTVAAFLSLFTRHFRPVDRCPTCGAQQTIFTRVD